MTMMLTTSEHQTSLLTQTPTTLAFLSLPNSYNSNKIHINLKMELLRKRLKDHILNHLKVSQTLQPTFLVAKVTNNNTSAKKKNYKKASITTLMHPDKLHPI